MGSLEVENERLRAEAAKWKRKYYKSDRVVVDALARISEVEAELEREREERGRWHLSDEDRHGPRAGLECPSGVAHGCTERCIHCDARDLVNDFRTRAEKAEAEAKEYLRVIEQAQGHVNRVYAKL